MAILLEMTGFTVEALLLAYSPHAVLECKLTAADNGFANGYLLYSQSQAQLLQLLQLILLLLVLTSIALT